jgi:diguanylate cyclase (GGDEF)-like protein
MAEIAGYRITHPIYESAHSQVYRGYGQASNPVILKVLKEASLTPIRLAEYRREYDIMHTLNLPGVVDAYALVMQAAQPVLVVEDFGGDSLDIAKLAKEMPLSVFFPLSISLSKTLEALHHRRIVHKDINPTNIVFNAQTTEVKLIDFGLSTRLPQETVGLVPPALLEGTLPYLAPEQTGRMNRPVDCRSDFYALGVTFYELLTGQLPFQADDPLAWVHLHIAQQPVHPSEIRAGLPDLLGQIVLKLMAKNAEERYQSAAGLWYDLSLGWQQWQANHQIQHFPLGQQDRCDRLQLSQEIYGREAALETLQTKFSEISNGEGLSQLVLVSGYSGVGKSALVQELYRPMTVKQGYFISGKFDQGNHVPYEAFSQAFNQLCRYFLTESSQQLTAWRSAILQAIKTNGQLLIDIIPDLELVIGPQPPVPVVGTQEAQNRLQRLFFSFVQAISQCDHPLVLFLDDLQWADCASIQLIETLFSTADTAHDIQGLMVVGAYRINEVEAHHRLMVAAQRLQAQSAAITCLELDNLPLTAVNAWLADTLDCSMEESRSLAQIVYEKTHGNAFFTAEFLKNLYAKKLLSFSPTGNSAQPTWQWDIANIRRQNITENVVDLITQQLVELSSQAKQAIQMAACLGSQFALAELALVMGEPQRETLTALMSAIELGLLIPSGHHYQLLLAGADPLALANEADLLLKFQHDRVQQAAYLLTAEPARREIHYRIGQALWQRDQGRLENLFARVNHLNFGTEFVLETTEPSLLQLAQLNLTAGLRALEESVSDAAQTYFETGLQLLGDESWQAQYDLTCQLSLGAAKAAFLLGERSPMQERIDQIMAQSRSALDAIAAYELSIEVAIADNLLPQAIELTLTALTTLGAVFPAHPDSDEIHAALELTATEIAAQSVGGQSLAELVALPEMTEARSLAIMRVLTNIVTPCFSARPTLMILLITYAMRLTLKEGTTDYTAFTCATYALILSGVVENLADSHQMGQLTRQLLVRYPAASIKNRTYHLLYAFVDHWHQPIKETSPQLLENVQLSVDVGDYEYASFSAHVYCLNKFLIGEPLREVAQAMATYRAMMHKFQQTTALNFQDIWHQATLNYLGEATNPLALKGEIYDEETRLPVHHQRQDATALLIAYWHKAMLCYRFGQSESAQRYMGQSAEYLAGGGGLSLIPVWHFYATLIRLDRLSVDDLEFDTPGDAVTDELADALFQVEDVLTKFEGWMARVSSAHAHRVDLIKAERSRVLGQVSKAMTYYDQAIDSARGNWNDLALASERAMQFYWQQGKRRIAQTYFEEARTAYRRWEATAKLKDLEQRYPELWAPTIDKAVDTARWTMDTSLRQLDAASLLKASQALAGDLQMDALLQRLMTLVLENAGAEKGCLLIAQAEDRWVLAASGDLQTGVSLTDEPEGRVARHLPVGLLNYVKRTQEGVVLDEARLDQTFGHDPYIQQHQPLSVLCWPLIHQSQLNGIVYLENNLVTHAFTAERLAVLKLLSSQAAISLQNARLYTQLQQYSHTLEDKVAERTAALEQANSELQRQATTDSLTQLANRRSFDQALSREWQRLMRSHQTLSLVLCDVDFFKSYNDCYGHLQGDRCLQQVAALLKTVLQRQTDVVARYGGEEFALILPGTALADAEKLAERLRSQVENLHISHENSPISPWVTISLGLASIIPSVEATSEQLIAAADQALYAAKSAGRNTYRVISSGSQPLTPDH